MVEFVLALGLFIGAVAVVGTTATSALSTRSGLARAVDLDAKLGVLVDEAATVPFVSLISGVFDVPALCGDQPAGAGAFGESCVTVAGQETRVRWQVELGPDAAGAAGGPSSAADWVRVTAAGETSSGFSSQRSALVRAPSPAWHGGSGVVRVELGGDVATLTTPVLLLGGAGFDQLVAGAVPSEDGTVVLRGALGACTTAAPCRLGLAPGANRGTGPTHDLVSPAGGDPAALIVFDQDTLVQRNALLVERGPAAAAPAAVEVHAPALTQGSAGEATVEVRDGSDQPVPGWPVAWSATVGGEPARGLWAQPAVCVTDGAGSCSVQVHADAAAPGGTWRLHASAGGATGSDTATVGVAASKLLATGASVAQGGSGTLVVRALDAAGGGVAGVAVSATGPAGVSISGGTTGGDGVAELAVSVAPTALSGPTPVSVHAGDLDAVAMVDVEGVARSVSAPGSVTVAVGTAQQVQVTVTDVNGTPVPAATVSATVSGDPVDVTARVSAGRDGVAQLWLVAETPGSATLRVEAGGSSANVAVTAT